MAELSSLVPLIILGRGESVRIVLQKTAARAALVFFADSWEIKSMDDGEGCLLLEESPRMAPSSMILLPNKLFRSLLAVVSLIPLGSPAQTATETKIEAMDRVYIDALFAMRDTYRKSIASVLADADKIEVYLLDFEMQDAHVHLVDGWHGVGSGFFPIMPYGTKSKILKTKVLSAEERKKLLPILRDSVAIKENSGGAFCHYPIHGVRLWAGEKLIFQSSFCWECANFYVPYPDQTADWVGMMGRKLENVLTELMPIPAREIERFNERKKGKKK